MLRTLKAEFSLSWASGKSSLGNNSSSRFGFPFKDSVMFDTFPSSRDEADAQNSRVDLIVSPALFKRGNNDGADYQTKSCCIKMVVVRLNALRFCKQTKANIVTQVGAPQEENRNLDAMQDIKEEDTNKEVIHAHSQPRHTPVGSTHAGEKDDNVLLQRGNPIETKAETSTSGSSPRQKSGTSDSVGDRAKVGGLKGKTKQKRKRFSDDDGNSDDPRDEDYDP